MKVLSVGSLPPRVGGGTHGGVATFHASLLEGLRHAGGDVEVVGVVPPAPLARDLDLPVFTRPPDTPMAEFYEDLLEQLHPDAVLMNHFAHTIGVTHARLRPEAAAVGIAHSWHHVTLRDGEERARARERTAEAMTGLGALVAVSRHCLREGEAIGFRYPQTTLAIHCPLQPFYVQGRTEVNAYRRAGIVCLGSLIPRKNPLALLEAAAGFPGLPLVFAGHGELERPLRSLIDARSVGDRVSIVHLGDREARDRLLRAEVMCMPSSSETFGLAYIEALACGTPVVGFGPTIREIREEIGIEIGEPLDSGSPTEIALAIERVLSSGWDREELRRATLETFGLRRATDRYVKLLSRVVRKRAAEQV